MSIVKKGIAVFDFVAKTEREVCFRKGDTIHLLSEVGAWWLVECNGERGYAPPSYITLDDQRFTSYLALVLWNFEAQSELELSVKSGERIAILEDFDEWVYGIREVPNTGPGVILAGFVPKIYISKVNRLSSREQLEELVKTARSNMLCPHLIDSRTIPEFDRRRQQLAKRHVRNLTPQQKKALSKQVTHIAATIRPSKMEAPVMMDANERDVVDRLKAPKRSDGSEVKGPIRRQPPKTVDEGVEIGDEISLLSSKSQDFANTLDFKVQESPILSSPVQDNSSQIVSSLPEVAVEDLISKVVATNDAIISSVDVETSTPINISSPVNVTSPIETPISSDNTFQQPKSSDSTISPTHQPKLSQENTTTINSSGFVRHYPEKSSPQKTNTSPYRFSRNLDKPADSANNRSGFQSVPMMSPDSPSKRPMKSVMRSQSPAKLDPSFAATVRLSKTSLVETEVNAPSKELVAILSVLTPNLPLLGLDEIKEKSIETADENRIASPREMLTSPRILNSVSPGSRPEPLVSPRRSLLFAVRGNNLNEFEEESVDVETTVASQVTKRTTDNRVESNIHLPEIEIETETEDNNNNNNNNNNNDNGTTVVDNEANETNMSRNFVTNSINNVTATTSIGSPSLSNNSATRSESSDNSQEALNLPPGWKRYFDEKSKRYYYYNRATKERSWKCPSSANSETKRSSSSGAALELNSLSSMKSDTNALATSDALQKSITSEYTY